MRADYSADTAWAWERERLTCKQGTGVGGGEVWSSSSVSRLIPWPEHPASEGWEGGHGCLVLGEEVMEAPAACPGAPPRIAFGSEIRPVFRRRPRQTRPRP